MKHGKLVALSVAVAVILGIFIIGVPSNAVAAEFNWKFQSHHTPGALSTTYVIPPFIDMVREKSGGRLNITLHYAGELVDYLEVFPSLQANMIQISNTSTLFWRGSLNVGWLTAGNLPPFVTRSLEDFEELYYKRGIDRIIGEEMAEKGIHYLGSHSVGNTYFWSKKPINSLDDLKGFKVRFFGAMNDTMEHFGASPVMLPHPETYMAIAMGTLDGGRIGIAAQALGIAQGALDETVSYGKERKQFGKPIGAFQNTQFRMADMKTRIEAARLLVYGAALAKDSGGRFSVEAAMAKLFASETAMEVTTKCVQLYGGYGYMRDYPVERMMRDAKITEIYEGTSEVQRMVVAGALLK